MELTQELAEGIQRPVYFRGQQNRDWKLQPSIDRLTTDERFKWAGEMPPNLNLREQERSLLHRFRRHSYEHRGRLLSDWEVLFLARHHGLPTRLLDWTSNPLVALYFAAEWDGDGGVWWVKRKTIDTVKDGQDLEVFDPQVKPLEVEGVPLQPSAPAWCTRSCRHGTASAPACVYARLASVLRLPRL